MSYDLESSKDNKLAGIFLAKLREQAERTQHLVAMIPPDKLDWRPEMPAGSGSNLRSIERLLGHLLDCLAGFCAALYAAHSDRLAHFEQLRQLPVNHGCNIEEFRQRLPRYVGCIEEGFTLLSSADLARRIPTVFVPEGEPLLTLLLGNLEHFINHKYQLFFYLKLLGVPLRTADLYQFRDESPAASAEQP